MTTACVPTSYLDGEVGAHHTVAGGEVPVHVFLIGQVRHAVSDLARHLQDLLQVGRLAAIVVLQAHEPLTM